MGKDPESKEFESGKVAKNDYRNTEKGYKLKSGKDIPDRTRMAQYYVVGRIGRSSRKVYKQRYASLYRREDTNSHMGRQRGG